MIGLHHHEANPGQPFRESRTGPDHISFGVGSRTALDARASWLDGRRTLSEANTATDRRG